jgi:hypothetical protein
MGFNIGLALGGAALGSLLGGSQKKPKEDPVSRAIREYLGRMMKLYGPSALSLLTSGIEAMSKQGAQKPTVIRRPLTMTEQLAHLYNAQAAARYGAGSSADLGAAGEALGLARPQALASLIQGFARTDAGMRIPDLSQIYAEIGNQRMQYLAQLGGMLAPYLSDLIKRPQPAPPASGGTGNRWWGNYDI